MPAFKLLVDACLRALHCDGGNVPSLCAASTVTRGGDVLGEATQTSFACCSRWKSSLVQKKKPIICGALVGVTEIGGSWKPCEFGHLRVRRLNEPKQSLVDRVRMPAPAGLRRLRSALAGDVPEWILAGVEEN